MKTSATTPGHGPVMWDCKIHRLHHCRRVRPPTNECCRYDTKLSDGEAPIIPELWGTHSTPSLALIPSSLWPGMVAPDSVPSMGQTELF